MVIANLSACGFYVYTFECQHKLGLKAVPSGRRQVMPAKQSYACMFSKVPEREISSPATGFMSPSGTTKQLGCWEPQASGLSAPQKGAVYLEHDSQEL